MPSENYSFVNIREYACLCLETVLLLEQRYGATYISRVLHGSLISQLEHNKLKTYASLSEVPLIQIQTIIFYLLRIHFLQVTQVHLGSLAITCLGEDFLAYPKDLIVRAHTITTSPLDVHLQKELQQLQKDLTQSERFSKYPVFSDYSLFRLLETKPQDLSELKMIPGFGDYQVNRYGPAILACIQKGFYQRIQTYQTRSLARMEVPSFQEEKGLYEAETKLYVAKYTSYRDEIWIDPS